MAKEKQEAATLQDKHDKREDRIHAQVMKQWQKLKWKIEETLDNGLKTWLVEAAKCQVLRADVENKQKEGRGLYKMDDTSI